MTTTNGQPKGHYIIAWIIMSVLSGVGAFAFGFVISIILMALTGDSSVVDELWFSVWVGFPLAIIISVGSVYVVYRKLFKKLNRAKVMIWFYTLWLLGNLSQAGQQANNFVESERGFMIGMAIFWLALGLFVIRRIMLASDQIDSETVMSDELTHNINTEKENSWTEK